MAKKKRVAYQRRRQDRFSLLLVTLVVVMILVVVTVKSVEMNAKSEENTAQMAVLQEQIDAEEARAEEIEEYRKYTQTKQFKEEMARDKLGLVYENEIIFKEE